MRNSISSWIRFLRFIIESEPFSIDFSGISGIIKKRIFVIFLFCRFLLWPRNWITAQ